MIFLSHTMGMCGGSSGRLRRSHAWDKKKAISVRLSSASPNFRSHSEPHWLYFPHRATLETAAAQVSRRGSRHRCRHRGVLCLVPIPQRNCLALPAHAVVMARFYDVFLLLLATGFLLVDGPALLRERELFSVTPFFGYAFGLARRQSAVHGVRSQVKISAFPRKVRKVFPHVTFLRTKRFPVQNGSRALRADETRECAASKMPRSKTSEGYYGKT